MSESSGGPTLRLLSLDDKVIVVLECRNEKGENLYTLHVQIDFRPIKLQCIDEMQTKITASHKNQILEFNDNLPIQAPAVFKGRGPDNI